MIADTFYAEVLRIMSLSPEARHSALLALHAETKDAYIAAVTAMSENQAYTPVNVGEDQRSLAQVVAHIAEWDRFAILSAGDMLVGIRHPRMITSVEGYIDAEGQPINFVDIDNFNAYHADKYQSLSWQPIQELALDTAETLYALFADPYLLNAKRLEQTKLHQKRLHNGVIIPDVRMGWNLWLTIVQHIAVEHAQELGLYP